MKKRIMKLSLCLLLALSLSCAAALPASAAGKSAVVAGKGSSAAAKTDKSEEAKESDMQLPASVLYYGTIKEITRGENGIQSLWLDSESKGEYVMHISEETVWIDSGNRTASDPATLKEGERVYIFHSPAATLSLPPQSSAFAVVRNIPQDARCAIYLEADEVKLQGKNKAAVTANNKTETFTIDEKTTFSPYLTRNIVALDDLKAGSRMMVWYDESSKNSRAAHIMILPEPAPLTCGEFIEMLYGDEQRPDADKNYYKRLSRSKPLSAETELTRELAVRIMWQKAGSPTQTAYRKLAQYSDYREITASARQAMVWAYQNKLIDTEAKVLDPQSALTPKQAAEMAADFAAID